VKLRNIAVMSLAMTIIFALAVLLDKPARAAEDAPTRDNFFKTEFVYESKVTIDPARISIEKSKYGGRNIIWITGGTFKGPNIEGTIIPGGADWQLVRPDGVTELDARYTLKTNDGVIIYVNNRVLSRRDPTPEDPAGQYRRCVLSFEAPLGSKYEWLNKSVFLGTLTPATTEKEAAVIIRVWRLL
jgi:hypothetical protein